MKNKYIQLALVLVFAIPVNTAFSKGIELLKHQQIPVEYLAEHDNVRGLIVNHYMGTGKTYLGVGFGERMASAGKSVIIIAPRFIEAHWLQHLDTYGVKDRSRYRFISYNDAPQVLLKEDLSKSVLIMDEVHNLIKLIKSPDPRVNRAYSDLYVHLRSAHKILALSGTPIYNDEYDFSYLINLVSGADLMPFNEEQFRIEFTKTNKGNSFWRGYVSESNLLNRAAPLVGVFTVLPLFAVLPPSAVGWVGMGAAIGSAVTLPVFNNWVAPIETTPLRALDTGKFNRFIAPYVSFYEIDNLDLSDFPTKTIRVESVAYNAEQFWFFLNFAEKSLGTKSMTRLYKDLNPKLDQAYLSLNSTLLQERLVGAPGAGREIGNFEFVAEDKSTLEPPKFLQILKKMKSQDLPKTVVYSNYFENGTQAFARFLDRQGLSGTYRVLHPEIPPKEFAEIVKGFDEGAYKILLLHPEITEGISLKGTRQFHILEPALNLTVLDQVIARAVRYQSHKSLPASERHVDVYIWQSVIPSNDLSIVKMKKANWFKRYPEMSDWSNFGQGISQVDKNYDRKRISPDVAAQARVSSVNQNILQIKALMREQSIEKTQGKHNFEEPVPYVYDEMDAKLDPIALPKTNFRMNWGFGHTLSYLGKTYKLRPTQGMGIDVEVPMWPNWVAGFYIEGSWNHGLKEFYTDPVAPRFDEARKSGEVILGFGGLLKAQYKVLSTFGDAALSLRVPLGLEVLLGPSMVGLFRDEADLKQYLQPGYQIINPSMTSGNLGYGVATGASLGVEYFPMEFIGLFADGGYKLAYHFFPVGTEQMSLDGKFLSKFEEFRGYTTQGYVFSAGIKLTY